MSFLSTLKGFTGWFARQWTKLFNAAPQVEHVVDVVISYAAPALQIILGALDPPAAAIVGPIISEIQKDLHVASALVYDFGANPNAVSILQGVTSELQSLLDAGHIKDSALQGKVTLVTNTIDSLVQALENSLKPVA